MTGKKGWQVGADYPRTTLLEVRRERPHVTGSKKCCGLDRYWLVCRNELSVSAASFPLENPMSFGVGSHRQPHCGLGARVRRLASAKAHDSRLILSGDRHRPIT
jgi:hypothetical protein